MSRKDYSRREFMGSAGMGVLSAGIGLPRLIDSAVDGGQETRFVYRTLGRTGLRIPVVSFGVMNTYSQALIRGAIDAGITHLDTANVYLDGNSELSIGRVLSETGKRAEIILSTKMRFARDPNRNLFIAEGRAQEPHATVENFRRQLSTSLERLRTDYVDILYLHSCYSPEMATFEPMMNELVRAKEEGKSRFIGVTIHKNVPEVIRAAVDAEVYDVIQVAYHYRDRRREEVRAACAYAAENDIGIVAMKVFAGSDPESGPGIVGFRTALRWVLEDENVSTAIPGMTTFDQLDFNLRIMGELGLSAAERVAIDEAYAEEGSIYCQNCRSCIPSCPERVEIPNLMRSYMYLEGYGNTWQAWKTTAELPPEKGLEVCRACTGCNASCPYSIPIGERIRTLLSKSNTRI